MQTLRETMGDASRFLTGVELVTTRGTLATPKASRTRALAEALAERSHIDWMSITDNAGGNPMLDPIGLGLPLLKRGKELVIHLACKDYNRNGLEARAWLFSELGFHNILALTGDYPIAGCDGVARAVSDIDSVALLSMLTRMNEGRLGGGKKPVRTSFFPGAVVTNFKVHENEVMPQYLKLDRKLEAGARFVVNQIGYDSRKSHELIARHRKLGRGDIPLVGNVYLLNARVAEVFNSGKIPGVVVSDGLLAECKRRAAGPDQGRAFFLELAARQTAIYRGLGYRAAYLGNIEDAADADRIVEMSRSYGPDDWKAFAREIRYSRPGEFNLFAEDPNTGLADPERLEPAYEASLKSRRATRNVTLSYRFSRCLHAAAFTPGTTLFVMARWIYGRAADKEQGPWWLRRIEKSSKEFMFECRECGDCSLPDVAYLCPESQCAKNQRNGPCGGTREGRCEVREKECLWARAYDRLKHFGEEPKMLAHAPLLPNNTLRETSSWANTFLGRDHFHHGVEKPPAGGAPPPGKPKKEKKKAEIGGDAMAGKGIPGLTIIAESINDSVPSTAKLYAANDIEGIKALARKQSEGNCGFIDVNVGRRDADFMAMIVREVQSVTDKPLSIDTPDPVLAEAGLKAYSLDRAQGRKPVLNSMSLLRMKMLDLYKICPFRPILLSTEGIDESGAGIPCRTVDDVHKAAQTLLRKIRESGFGIKNEDLIIDPGIAPIAGDMEGITKRVLDSIARIKADPDFAGAHFSVGLSNFTVMLPPKRANGKPVKTPLQNAFLTKAVPLGLDMIIGAADRDYKILPPGDDALACLEEALAMSEIEAIMRVQKFYS
jgi:methylenetetrahydrofolate reductase (NADPH)